MLTKGNLFKVMVIPTILMLIRSTGMDQDSSWSPEYLKYISAISSGIKQMPLGAISGVVGLAEASTGLTEMVGLTSNTKGGLGQMISRSGLVKFFHVYQLLDLYDQFIVLKDNTNLIWTLHKNLKGGEISTLFDDSMAKIKVICDDIEPLVDDLKMHYQLGDKQGFKQTALYISWKFERIAAELNVALQKVVGLIEKIDTKQKSSYTTMALRGVAGLSAFAFRAVGIPIPAWSLAVGGAETVLAATNIGLEYFIASEKASLVNIQKHLELFQDYVKVKADEFARLSRRGTITKEEMMALREFNFSEVQSEINTFEMKINSCLNDKCNV